MILLKFKKVFLFTLSCLLVLSISLTCVFFSIAVKAEETIPENFSLDFKEDADYEVFKEFTGADSAGGLPRAQSPSMTKDISEGVMTISTNSQDNYAWAEYRLGVSALENYEIEYDIDILGGRMLLAGRAPENTAMLDTSLFYSLNAGAGGGTIHTQLMSRSGGSENNSFTESYIALPSGRITIRLSFINNTITYDIGNKTSTFTSFSSKGITGDVGFVIFNDGGTGTVKIHGIKFTNSDKPFDPNPVEKLVAQGGSDRILRFQQEAELSVFDVFNSKESGCSQEASFSLVEGKAVLSTNNTDPYNFAEIRLATEPGFYIDLDDFVISMDVKVNSGSLYVGGRTAYDKSVMTQGVYFSLDKSGNGMMYSRMDANLTDDTSTYQNFGTSEFRLTVKMKEGTLSVKVNEGTAYNKSATFDSFNEITGGLTIAVVNDGAPQSAAAAEIDNVWLRMGDLPMDETMPDAERGFSDIPLLKFDNTQQEAAQAFVNKLAVRNVAGANGRAYFNEAGNLVLEAGSPGVVNALTEFRLNATNLENYTVSFEIEQLGGQLLFGTRIAEHSSLFDTGYQVQMGHSSTQDMQTVETDNLRRSEGNQLFEYVKYDGANGSYKNLGTNKFVIRIVMEDEQMSVYIGDNPNPTYNKLDSGEFDPIYKGVKGDFVIGVFNTEKSDAKVVIKKFGFENAADHTWPDEDFIWSGTEFGEIDRTEFTPEKSYAVGDKIRLSLDQHFTYTGDGGFNALNLCVAGDIGTITDGVWEFIPEKAGVYEIVITAKVVGSDIKKTLSFKLNVTDGTETNAKSGCGSSVSAYGGLLISSCLIGAALFIGRRRCK